MPSPSSTPPGIPPLNPVRLLQDLVRFDTANPPGNERACIVHVQEILAGAGCESVLLGRVANRPNLIARLGGRGQAPPLLLLGHVDVVPARGEPWRHPPFDGRIAGGYLWGRGALDMKGGVAMMLTAFLRLKAGGVAPPGDVILALVSDEEAGGEFGAKYLVEDHPDLGRPLRYRRVRGVQLPYCPAPVLSHHGGREANMCVAGNHPGGRRPRRSSRPGQRRRAIGQGVAKVGTPPIAFASNAGRRGDVQSGGLLSTVPQQRPVPPTPQSDSRRMAAEGDGRPGQVVRPAFA